MELLITLAYIFLIRLIFFDFALLKYNLFWKIFTFGLWIVAALTEVIYLGQLTPYSKEMFVQSYVVQMAPEFGGMVEEVYVQPNQHVKKGTPLFQMDKAPWQDRVNGLEAQLATANSTVSQMNQAVIEAQATLKKSEAILKEAQLSYEQVASAATNNAVSKLRFEQSQEKLEVAKAGIGVADAVLHSAQIALEAKVGDEHAEVAAILSELEQAKYNLEHSTVRAPSDGHVANLQLYPGSFIRLKQPVMSFVNTETNWLVATIPQRATQHVRPGDKAQFALEMYPGKIFEAVVDNVAFANGASQGIPSGKLPNVGQMKGSQLYTVRLNVTNPDPDCPVQFGASGLLAIYTKNSPDFLVLLRQIEIQSESFLNYLYNPFK